MAQEEEESVEVVAHADKSLLDVDSVYCCEFCFSSFETPCDGSEGVFSFGSFF